MQVWNALSEVSSDFGATAVTIGKYDAIHLGHAFLLNKLIISRLQAA